MDISRREVLGLGALAVVAAAIPSWSQAASASPGEVLASLSQADFSARVGKRVSIAGHGRRGAAELVAVTPVVMSSNRAGTGEIFAMRFRPVAGQRFAQEVYSVNGLSSAALPLLLVPTGDGRDLIATINRWLPTHGVLGEKS